METSKSSKLTLVLVGLAAIAVTGCSSTIRRVTFSPVRVEVLDKVERGTKLVVPAFEDLRSERSIGYVRNPIGYRAADVEASNSPVEFVKQSFTESLQLAGFAIQDKKPSDGDLVLRGTVMQVSGRYYIAVKGRITVNVKLTRGEKTLLQETFHGQKNDATASAGSIEFTNALHDSMEDVLRQAIPAICQALNAGED